eukprot:142143-Amphidinium_carterae.2
MIRALYPLVLYGSEVSGLAQTSLNKVRVSARRALGRGAQLRRAAELELALKGGIKADPQAKVDPPRRRSGLMPPKAVVDEDLYATSEPFATV